MLAMPGQFAHNTIHAFVGELYGAYAVQCK